jgi:hypothetical protein
LSDRRKGSGGERIIKMKGCLSKMEIIAVPIAEDDPFFSFWNIDWARIAAD